MDGSSVAEGSEQLGSASDRGARDASADAVVFSRGSSGQGEFVNAIAILQLAFLTIVILAEFLTRDTAALSTASAINGVLVICGFAIQTNHWAKARHNGQVRDGLSELVRSALHAAAIVFISATLSMHLSGASGGQLDTPRTFFLLLTTSWSRFAIFIVVKRLTSENMRRVAVFGDGEAAVRLAQQVKAKRPGMSVSLFPVAQFRSQANTTAPIHFSTCANPKLVELAPDIALISSSVSDETIDQLASQLAPHSLDVLVQIPHQSRWAIGPIVNLDGTQFVRIFPRPLRTYQMTLKRALDIWMSSTLIVLLLPLLLCVAMAIKIDSRGPFLFRQPRVGRAGIHFMVWKFRTMKEEATDPLADRATVMNDPRITRVGALLRKFSIDELPQLFNVLFGSMSIVGPRPHAMNGNGFSRVMPNYDARHRVKPGITGLAQILGWRGPTDTATKIEQRVANDLRYISNWSFGRDILIIGRTLFALCGKNAF
jgi:exopolysaccharide biosynthesis polyprenyl glycosylphosphotransferase